MSKVKRDPTTKRWLRQFKYDPYMALVLGTRLWVAHHTLEQESNASNPSTNPSSNSTQPWPSWLRPYAFPDHARGASSARKGRPRHRTYHATLQFWAKLTLTKPFPAPLPRLSHLICVLIEALRQQKNLFTHTFGDTTVNGADVVSMLGDLQLFQGL